MRPSRTQNGALRSARVSPAVAWASCPRSDAGAGGSRHCGRGARATFARRRPLSFSSPSPPWGRGWTAAGAFFSRGGPGEGVPPSPRSLWLATLVATLLISVIAVTPARGQDMTSKDAPIQEDSVAGGAERHSSPELDNAKEWIKRFAGDQRDLWTSLDRVRSNDTDWLLMLGGAAAGLMAADHAIMQHNNLSVVNTRRSVDFSNLGVGALVGVGGALYLWGKKTGDDHEQETGLLSGE